MKKIIISVIVLLMFAVSCKKNEPPKVDNGLNIKTYVTVQAGLVLRATPDTSGQALATIPFKEEVIIVKYSEKDSTISKITAPWAFIRYKNQEGWLFAGYLNGSINKGNYKNHDLNKLRDEVSKAYRTTFKELRPENETVYNTPEQIKIVEVNGDLAIVEFYAAGCLEFNPETAQGLWYYKDGKWNDFEVEKKLGLDACPTSARVSFVYIDNDQYIDVILSGGVSDSSWVDVYLYDGSSFTAVDFPPDGNSIIEEAGQCGTTELFIYNYTDQGQEVGKRYKFNCRTKKFE